MRLALRSFFHFLPVQLLLLHLRKYQLLLLFWVVVTATITGHFARIFGADALFLAPEYFGKISFTSMLILGVAMGMFVMAWHITTFIIHSKRMPFIGATRHSFLNYCINNSLLPLLFLVLYSVLSMRFLRAEEGAGWGRALALQGGFYCGFLVAIFFSFFYFFRVGRDLLKQVIATITNPAQLRSIIPYDSLDKEFYMIRADTYISGNLKIEHIKNLEQYHPRLLATVLRRHHRNAVFVTIIGLVFLLVSGAFMEQPVLRIPAGASFLILFAVMMGVVGAVKYFLRSWELIGWLLMLSFISWLVSIHVFDLRSVAYGIQYPAAKSAQPRYDYALLQALTDSAHTAADKELGIAALNNWKAANSNNAAKPPLIVCCVSGGGLRAAYWTFHCLRLLDSATGGAFARHTAFLSGASGGMLGAAYWRGLLDAQRVQPAAQPWYLQRIHEERVGSDLINAIIFSMASVDLISPFNKITVGGRRFSKDRGYAMEQELNSNTGGLLRGAIGDYRSAETLGLSPQFVYSSTVINDGRKLLFSAQPVSYLCRPGYAAHLTNPPVDAVDFRALFANQQPDSLRLTSILRMNATFPFILPVVKLPSNPEMNIMDAGLRDNFGLECLSRWLYVFREWLTENTREVIVLQIRDTREYEVFPSTTQSSLGAMLLDPATAITTKWEPFQSYTQGYIKDYIPAFFPPGKVRFVTLQYEPKQLDKRAALNFHLTHREMEDIRAATTAPDNMAGMDMVIGLLKR